MMWWTPVIWAAFVVVFSYDFATSGDPMRRISDLIGLLAVGVAAVGVAFALDVGILPGALAVLALFGHVMARALVQDSDTIAR